MTLTADDVKAIAHLARLGVDDHKLDDYAGEISSILDLIQQMDAADTAGIEPMAHPVHATQRLRSDLVSESDQREQLQRGAPAVKNGLFLVPKVIE